MNLASIQRSAAAVRHGALPYVKSAPLTYSWLVLLLVTTTIQHHLPSRWLWVLLDRNSTNLRHLATDPVRVLIESLVWIDGWHWWPYAVAFTLFLAPAERWLGRLRWLGVGLGSHVGATYLSEGYLYWRIQEGISSPRLVNVRDIGVSYFVVGIVGVLAYHIPSRWRRIYVIAALVVFGVALALQPDFTQLGHFTALLIGLASYPLIRSRQREDTTGSVQPPTARREDVVDARRGAPGSTNANAIPTRSARRADS
jgi:hypothetical protein